MHYITQSEIKTMLAYEAGACGLQLEHELKHGRESTPTMKLGIYFEYLVSGALPRSKVIPEPELTLKGELTAPYKVVVSQADRLKTYLKRMGITYSAGVYIQNKKLKIAGHIDMIGKSRAIGEFVLDLKYSGLMDDRWSDMGWSWTERQKIYHRRQAIHYHLITGLDFYYLVTESRDAGRIELFKVEFSQESITEHLELVDRTREFFKEMELGLEPRPEVTKCEACALYQNCNHRAIYPDIKLITV